MNIDVISTPSPGLHDTVTQLMTPGATSDMNKTTHEHTTPGHQGVKTSGGSNKNLRVLFCINLDKGNDYETIYDKMRPFGEIKRMKLKFASGRTKYDCYITFADSDSAQLAYDALNTTSSPFLGSKGRLLNFDNLEEEEYDFVPASCGIDIHRTELMDRHVPLPTWFVATYKTGQENKHTALKHIQKKAGHIPPTNLKLYGRNLLIKAGNEIQADLLLDFKTSDTSNVGSITPHRTFNTQKGVIYSKDLYEFDEYEILALCPPSVLKVRKLSGKNNAILLIFSSKYLPDYIYIDQFRTKVKKFIHRPTQCYKCFEYGHVVHKCNNNRRCRNCSMEHRDDDECLATPFCFNCDGDHSPSSRTCPRYKLEQEILEVANNNFISIGSAKRQVLSANKDVNSTYASAIKSFKYLRQNSYHKEIQKNQTKFSSDPILDKKRLTPEVSRESPEHVVVTTAEIHAESSNKGCSSLRKENIPKPSRMQEEPKSR